MHHALTIIDVFTTANGGEEFVVLDLVHVRLSLARLAETPDDLAVVVFDVRVRSPANDEAAFGAANVVGIFIETSRGLS